MSFAIVLMHTVCKVYILALAVIMMGVLTGKLRLRSIKYDACIEGKYYSRRLIVSGKGNITDQLAIYRHRHILYLQYNHDLNTGISLHNLESWTAYQGKTSGMAFDNRKDKQTLYLGSKVENGKLHSHKYKGVVTVFETYKGHISPEKMFIGPGGWPCSIDKIRKGIYCYEEIHRYEPYHRNRYGYWYYRWNRYIEITYRDLYHVAEDIVMYREKGYVYLSNSTVYHRRTDGSTIAIAKGNYVLSSDQNGNVFLAHPTSKMIIKFDPTCESKTLYGIYRSPLIKDFVFDKDNNIVFRDANDRVAQWVPDPGNRPCECPKLQSETRGPVPIARYN